MFATVFAQSSLRSAPLLVTFLLLPALLPAPPASAQNPAAGSAPDGLATAGETSSPDTAEAAFQFARAKLLADAGDFDGALAAYEKAIRLDPGDPYSLVELARFQSYLSQIARSSGQQRELLDEAARNAALAKTAAPENPDVLETYGQVHMRLGELDPTSASLALAQGAFEILRKQQPGDLQVLLSLGQLYLWQQDPAKAVEVLEAAAKTSPGHRMVLSMLVEAQLAAGENDGAIESLRLLVRVESANAEHRIRLAELLAGRDEHAEAVAVLADTPPEMAPSPRLKQILARELHLVGRNQEALALVDELAGRFPGNDGMRRLRAAILSGLTRYRDAIAELEPLARKELDPERRSQDVLLLARLKERVGEGDQAAELITASLEDFHGESRVEAMIALAGILERSGRAGEAEQQLREALGKATGSDLVQLGGALAEILNGQDQYDQAYDLYSDLRRRVGGGAAAEPLAWRQVLLATAHKNWQQVLELLPGLQPGDRAELAAAVDQLKATALAGLGRVDEALTFLASSTALSPEQARVKRWEILEDTGRGAELSTELEGIAGSGKKEDQLFAVQMLQRFERYAEAVPLFEKLLAGDPDSPELTFGLAVAYERSGQRAPAIRLFEKLLDRDPNHAGSLNYLGYMFAERGEQLDRALGLILRAVSLEPDNGAYVDSLGWTYYQLGRYAEAREQLEWAVRLIGEDATLHEHLGAVYSKLDQLDKAKRAFQKALLLETKSERKAEIQKRLDSLTRRPPGKG